MPLNVLLTFIIGTSLGILLVKVTRVPHHLQGLVLGCCAAGRVTSTLKILTLPMKYPQTKLGRSARPSPLGENAKASWLGQPSYLLSCIFCSPA